MTGARMIMQVLADEGVTAIFGYSGGAILPTYDAVFLYNEQRGQAGEPQIPLIVPANEQGAGFMAAGYARASGRVGRLPGDLRSRCDEHCYTGARLHGRFGADCRHLRPSRDAPRSVPTHSRRRRSPP